MHELAHSNCTARQPSSSIPQTRALERRDASLHSPTSPPLYRHSIVTSCMPQHVARTTLHYTTTNQTMAPCTELSGRYTVDALRYGMRRTQTLHLTTHLTPSCVHVCMCACVHVCVCVCVCVCVYSRSMWSEGNHGSNVGHLCLPIFMSFPSSPSHLVHLKVVASQSVDGVVRNHRARGDAGRAALGGRGKGQQQSPAPTAVLGPPLRRAHRVRGTVPVDEVPLSPVLRADPAVPV